MTLVLKLDLDVVKMYQHIKIKLSISSYSKVITRTQYENNTFPLTRAIRIHIISKSCVLTFVSNIFFGSTLDFVPPVADTGFPVPGEGAPVKRLRCSSDSLLQIERSCRAMHAIVNLSSLVNTHLGSTKIYSLSCSLVN